jgi:hypothetical protein
MNQNISTNEIEEKIAQRRNHRATDTEPENVKFTESMLRALGVRSLLPR